MSKNVTNQDPDLEEGELTDDVDALGSIDFNVDEEYRPDPLIPKGIYHANVISTKFNPAQFCIVWDFCLHDNGGVMNDGQAPVDGAHVFFRNWLPKPGDESIPTKSGKTNKRQSKINMLKDFQESLGVDMSTPSKIATGIQEQAWVGFEADLEIDAEEYQGRFRNVVNRVKKSSMY